MPVDPPAPPSPTAPVAAPLLVRLVAPWRCYSRATTAAGDNEGLIGAADVGEHEATAAAPAGKCTAVPALTVRRRSRASRPLSGGSCRRPRRHTRPMAWVSVRALCAERDDVVVAGRRRPSQRGGLPVYLVGAHESAPALSRRISYKICNIPYTKVEYQSVDWALMKQVPRAWIRRRRRPRPSRRQSWRPGSEEPACTMTGQPCTGRAILSGPRTCKLGPMKSCASVCILAGSKKMPDSTSRSRKRRRRSCRPTGPSPRRRTRAPARSARHGPSARARRS